MRGEAEPTQNWRLIVWWSLAGLALAISLGVVFWAGFRSGQTSSFEPSVTVDDSQSPQPSTDPVVAVDTELDLADKSGDDDLVTDEPSTEVSNDDLNPDLPTPELPEDWVQLSPIEKIRLNPFGCDLGRQEVDLSSGQCRQTTTLASKSRPWNPIALNRISISEIESRESSLECHSESPPWLFVGGSSLDDNNQDIWYCFFRVTLEMTIDDFYFASGCRYWQEGFVKLSGVSTSGQTKNYDSLELPAPGTVCTQAIVPVDKGQQIEQIFLFVVPDSDFDITISQVQFDSLQPQLIFDSSFVFEFE